MNRASSDALTNIAELHSLDSRRSLIRIPGELDVPITPRVQRLVDSQPFQRLSRISQLGLVRLVYPGATHTRFEHSLGAYRNCLLFLKRLSQDERFTKNISKEKAEELIVASLLHDIGHWPYCHAIEDMGLDDVPDHECLAEHWMNADIGGLLESDWGTSADRILALLRGTEPSDSLAQSILSGPIDIDKMDYLFRDSLHCGVPYGMNYDRQRLIGSLCVDEDGSRIGITEKGATAAELMVFARYVMFSEVYWHHTVRAATAMVQRAFYRLRDSLDLEQLFRSDDAQFHSSLLSASRNSGDPLSVLCQGIFGHSRQVFKRLGQFSYLDSPEVFDRLAGKPYEHLVKVSSRIAQDLKGASSPEDVLVDAPPANLEVQFRVRVQNRESGDFRWLEQSSPVVKTLAREQFDKYVKRVRVFVRPNLVSRRIPHSELVDLVLDATDGD